MFGDPVEEQETDNGDRHCEEADYRDLFQRFIQPGSLVGEFCLGDRFHGCPSQTVSGGGQPRRELLSLSG